MVAVFLFLLGKSRGLLAKDYGEQRHDPEGRDQGPERRGQ
jgi:hypothetical protein